MTHARTPTLGVVIGEGASGGAIPLASVDFLIALENTHLSVISPEGCAGILRRDRHHAPEAANELRSTARDLARDGIVDRLIPEPDVPAVLPVDLVAQVGRALDEALEFLEALGTDRLLERRRARFHRDAARIRGAPVVERAGSP